MSSLWFALIFLLAGIGIGVELAAHALDRMRFEVDWYKRQYETVHKAATKLANIVEKRVAR